MAAPLGAVAKGCAITVALVLLAAGVPAAAAANPAPTATPLCCAPSGSVHALALSGTTAYIGGDFRHMGRYTGSFAALDPASGQPRENMPVVDGTVRASLPDGAGGSYIGGSFTAVDGVPRGGLAHILPDGTLDPAWAPSTDGDVFAMAAFGSTVFVGGEFDSVNGGTPRTHLAGFDRTTGATTGFAPELSVAAGDASVRALAVLTNPLVGGQSLLFVGGRFDEAAGQDRDNLAAFDPSAGTLDPGFDPVVFDTVRALLVRDIDPRPAVTVSRVFAGGDDGLLAAFDLDGNAAWGPSGGTSDVLALAARGSTIYVGGEGVLAGVDQTTGDPTGWGPPVGDRVSSLAVLGSTVYVGGRFFAVDGDVARTNLAAFDAVTGVETSWDPDAPSPQGVATLTTDGNSVFAGGDFVSVGGAERNRLAAIDLASGQLTAFNPDVDGPAGTFLTVSALALSGGTLYAGGRFETVNGSLPRRNLAAFDTASGAVTAFDPHVDGQEVRALAVAGDRVFAGGVFDTVNGSVARTNLAAFDAVTGVARQFAPVLNQAVNALAIIEPTLYVGGAFTQVNAAPRNRMAALQELTGTTGVLRPFDPNFDNLVSALEVGGSTIFVGGGFTAANGGAVEGAGLAAVDAVSGAAAGWADHVDIGNPNALALGDGLLFAGGFFFQAGGQPRNHLAAFDAATGALSGWAPEPDAEVRALASSPEAGLVVGGDFTRLQQPLTRVARLAAFALPPAAPAAPVASAGNGQATISFSPPASGGAPIDRYTVTASPGGQTVTGAGNSIVMSGLTNGTTYTFTVAATNRAGTGRPSPPSNPVTPAVGPGVNPDTGPGVRDLVAPIVRRFRMLFRRFAVARGRTPRAARARRGTAFLFRLSEEARVSLTIARTLAGRRKGGRCIKPRRGLKRKCKRYRRVVTLTRARSRAGPNRIKYTGRVGRRTLRPGRYRASLRATDAAGNRSRAVHVGFTVVRR